MKPYNNNKTIFLCLGLIFLIGGMFSCRSMDDSYKIFLKGGEHIYPVKIDTVIVYSGKNKIKLFWPVFDSTVTRTKIFWQNRTDSVIVPVDENTKKSDTVSVSILNLKEGDYTFIMENLDDDNNVSIPISVNGHVYGDTYASTIKNRLLLSAIPSFQEMDFYTLQFTKNDREDMVGTICRYKNKFGNLDSLFVPADSNEVHVKMSFDVNDSTVSYYSIFSPRGSIDPFFTSTDKVNFSTILILPDIPKAKWKVIGSTPSATSVTNLIDGNDKSLWYTFFLPLPHYVSIDMGQDYTIHGFRFVGRGAYTGQDPKGISFLFSDDGINFKNKVDLTVPPLSLEATVTLSYPITARYFKWVIRTQIDNNTPITQLMELYVF